MPKNSDISPVRSTHATQKAPIKPPRTFPLNAMRGATITNSLNNISNDSILLTLVNTAPGAGHTAVIPGFVNQLNDVSHDPAIMNVENHNPNNTAFIINTPDRSNSQCPPAESLSEPVYATPFDAPDNLNDTDHQQKTESSTADILLNEKLCDKVLSRNETDRAVTYKLSDPRNQSPAYDQENENMISNIKRVSVVLKLHPGELVLEANDIQLQLVRSILDRKHSAEGIYHEIRKKITAYIQQHLELRINIAEIKESDTLKERFRKEKDALSEKIIAICTETINIADKYYRRKYGKEPSPFADKHMQKLKEEIKGSIINEIPLLLYRHLADKIKTDHMGSLQLIEAAVEKKKKETAETEQADRKAVATNWCNDAEIFLKKIQDVLFETNEHINEWLALVDSYGYNSEISFLKKIGGNITKETRDNALRLRDIIIKSTEEITRKNLQKGIASYERPYTTMNRVLNRLSLYSKNYIHNKNYLNALRNIETNSKLLLKIPVNINGNKNKNILPNFKTTFEKYIGKPRSDKKLFWDIAASGTASVLLAGGSYIMAIGVLNPAISALFGATAASAIATAPLVIPFVLGILAAGTLVMSLAFSFKVIRQRLNNVIIEKIKKEYPLVIKKLESYTK